MAQCHTSDFFFKTLRPHSPAWDPPGDMQKKNNWMLSTTEVQVALAEDYPSQEQLYIFVLYSIILYIIILFIIISYMIILIFFFYNIQLIYIYIYILI